MRDDELDLESVEMLPELNGHESDFEEEEVEEVDDSLLSAETDLEFDEEKGRSQRLARRRPLPPRFPGKPRRTRPSGAVRPMFRRRVAGQDAAPCTCSPKETENIRWVQSSLNQIMGQNLLVTGVMNRTTRAALRDFQRQQGLPVDGIVGPGTERALSAAKGGKTNRPGEPYQSEAFENLETEEWESEVNRKSKEYIRWVQRSLNSFLGAGLAEDGIGGSKTKNAIRTFQNLHALPADGIVGRQTEAMLIQVIGTVPPSIPPAGNVTASQPGKGFTFANAIAIFGGLPVDPFRYPESVEGFQRYLDDTGVPFFSAKEMTTPRDASKAKNFGYKIFLPKQEWWPRGAALAKLAEICRAAAGSPVRMRNWWRPKGYNEAVGGAPNGDHPTAHGIDLDYQTIGARRAAESTLKAYQSAFPWLQMSLGLGYRTTHVGIMSPRGERTWLYKGYIK